MNDNCPETGELERLIRGRLTESRAAVVTEHVGFCPECQERMESLAAGGDPALTKTVRLCRQQAPPRDSAMWPALSAVAQEVASTGLYSRGADTDAEGSGELDLNFLQPANNPQLIGRLGEFEIKRVVGRGGMGVVLHGYDTHLQRDIAVKVLDPLLADNEVARIRFCREARAAAAVTHDNLVAVHQVNEDAPSGLPYLVMQLVVGESLEQRLKRVGKLSPEDVAKLGQQAAAGLAAAHAGGLIHRDIKPGNILIEEVAERVKLTDFGLARGVEDVRLTRTGFVAGTPLYMAPEQAHGENIDHRSDLFSLGSVLYEAASGRHPFEGKTPLAVLRRVADETQPALIELDPNFPVWLSDVIDRLLAKNPDDRFQTAAEVAEIFSLELARQGIEMPTGCGGKTSAYSLRARKPICWKTVSFRVLPVLAGIAIGALAVGLWPSQKPEASPLPLANGNGHAVDPGPEPLSVIAGNLGPVWALDFTPDGQRLAIGSEDGTIRLFEKLTEKEPLNFRTLTRTGRHVWTIDISKDGKYLVAPSDELQLEVFDLEKYKADLKFAPGASTKAAAFSPDGAWLITGNRDGAIRVWSMQTYIPVDLNGNKGTAHSLVVSPDSQLLAAAGSDGAIKLWKLNDLKADPELLDPHSGPLYGLSFSPEPANPLLASAGWDGAVRIWDPRTSVQKLVLRGHEGDVFGVSFRKDGKQVASAGADGTVRLWDVESGKELQVFRGSGRAFHTVRFSPDGTLLAAGSRDGTVRIWDVK